MGEIADLKDQLEAEIAAREAAENAHRPGDNWFQLSEAEEEVFGIERARFLRMVMAHHCYEGFKDMTGGTWDDALLDQARQQHPEWCGPGQSVQEFMHFAKVYGGLTHREAYAIFYKMDFWTHRLGVMDYADEQEGPA